MTGNDTIINSTTTSPTTTTSTTNVTTCTLGEPYDYEFPNGTNIPTGYLDGFGTCIVENTDCETDLECCSTSTETDKGIKASTLISNIGSPIVLILFFRLSMRLRRREKELQEAENGEFVNPMAAKRASGSEEMPPWKRNAWIAFARLSSMAGIMSIIMVPIIMRPSIQKNLTPNNRSASLAADAFLVPFEEVFSFLEDTMVVRINFAIGSGQYEQLNLLLNVGLAAGLILGSVAAGIASLLTLSESVFEKLVYPGGAIDALDFPGCGLLPSTSHVLDEIKSYWLLRVWKWPFVFMGLTLNGFFIGSGRFELYGWPLFLNAAVLLGIWFLELDHVDNKLTLLGTAHYAASMTAFLFVVIVVAFDKKLKKKYGLKLLCCSGSCWRKTRGDALKEPLVQNYAGLVSDETEFPAERTRSKLQSLRNGPELEGGRCELLVDGFKAMILEMSCQLFVTVGVYVAANRGIATSYKIAAVQSAMPTFGWGWACGIAFGLKVIGSNLIASQQFRWFRSIVFLFVLIGFLYGVVALVAIEPHKNQIAAEYGISACGYASEEACSGVYRDIFDGSNPLTNSFGWLGGVTFLQCVFAVLKSGLYCCLDFNFMAATSFGSLICIFTPAIIVANTHYGGTAEAIFVAMYLPYIFLVPAFAWRLLNNANRMVAGDHGPWGRHLVVSKQAQRIRSQHEVMLTSA